MAQQRWLSRFLAPVALVLLAFLTGCFRNQGAAPPQPGAPPQPPVITAPATVTANQAGNLALVVVEAGVSYQWTITNGTLTDGAATPSVTFTAGAAGSLALTCTATNPAGSASATATVSVTADSSVPAAPVIAAPAVVVLGNGAQTVRTQAQANCAYTWVVAGGTIVAGQGTPTVTFVPDDEPAPVLGLRPRSLARQSLAAADAVNQVVLSCTVTNAASGQSNVATVAVPEATVTGVAPSGLAYAFNPAKYAVGSPVLATQSSSGGTVTQYTVTPSLPDGLSLNPTTGLITGTPTTLTPVADYVVTASNLAGNASTTLTLTINDAAPANLDYAPDPAAYAVGDSILIKPSHSGGAVDGYAVAPDLPPGLTLDAASGVISGTRATPAAAATYRITASNRTGSATASLSLRVDATPSAAPVNLVYAFEAPVYTVGTPIPDNAPASGGGAVASYSVSPALPAGLALDGSGHLGGTPAADAVARAYTVTATGVAGGATTATLLITVLPVAPSIPTQPSALTVLAGQSATFTLVGSGAGTLSYQWFRNGLAILGANASTYTTRPVRLTDRGAVFTVVVSNAGGSVTSNPVTLTVTATSVAPAILTQPQGQTVTTGQSTTFLVAASGSAPLTYQWRRNGTAIAGANGAGYSTPPVSAADDGSVFDVVVGNDAGSVTSAPANLAVTSAAVAPALLVQPAGATIPLGQAVTFLVNATGTAPLSYQWRRNGTALPGATGPAYTTGAASLADSGASFDVVVSNGAGNVTSLPAILTVSAPHTAPAITGQPADLTVTAGQAALFTVTATGTPALTYQWSKDGAPLPGAQAATCAIAAAAAGDAGAYSVTVTNGSGSVTSRAAALAVTPAGALTLAYASPLTLTAGTAMAAQGATVGNAAPGVATTFALTAGALPAGLNLAQDTGLITGTPTGSGVSTFTITAGNGLRTGACTATWTVVPAAALSLSYVNPGTLTAGVAMATQAPTLNNVTLGLASTFAVTQGALPAGLTLDPGTGFITGTPSAPGVTPFTVTASNGTRTATADLTYTVAPAGALTLGYAPNPVATAGVASTFPAAVGNATPGVVTTFALTGTLPTGLALAANGSLAGTATAPGVYAVTVTASNGTRTASAAVSLTVTPASPMTLVYASPLTLTAGTAMANQVAVLANTTPGVATTFAAPALPPGLALAANGTLSGTPSTPGFYPFTVTASNGTLSASCNLAYTVTPVAALTLAYANPQVFPANTAIPSQGPDLRNATPGVATTFALTGTLPNGLALDANGAITGTPTVPGVFTPTITATNGTRTATATFTCTIIPPGALGLAYTTPITVPEGSPIPDQQASLVNATPGVSTVFTVSLGTLPAGLTLDATFGTLAGTPTVPGLSTFTVTAVNGAHNASATLTYTVTPAAALTLAYTTPQVLPVGVALAAPLAPALANATPGVPTTYAVTAGALPDGLTLAADGTIAGTPTTPGQFSPTLTATNGARTASATPTYAVSPAGALTLAYTTQLAVPAGAPIGLQSPTVSNATPGAVSTFTVSAGLPNGLSLAADTGVISGTPTDPGVHAFTVAVSNGLRSASASLTYTVTPAAALTLGYATPQIFTAGAAIAAQPATVANATPGVALAFTDTPASLPPGLTVDAATGLITGTPTAPGVYPVTLQLTNGTRSASASPTYTVTPAGAFTLAYASGLTVAAGTAMADQAPLLGNTTPGVAVTYALTQGALPAGLSLASDTGVLSGSPAIPGVYTFTVTASNGTRQASASPTWTVTSGATLTLAYATPLTFTANAPIPAQNPAVGNATPGVATSFAVTVGAVPQGLALDGPTGQFTGTPTVPGVSTFTITATNGTLQATSTVTCTVTSDAPLSLAYPVTAGTFNAQAGTALGALVPTLANATPGVTLSYGISAGALPSGLSLANASGILFGTPTVPGVYPFTVTVTDGTLSASLALTCQVFPAAPLTLAYATPLTFPAGSAIAPQNPALGNPMPGFSAVFAFDPATAVSNPPPAGLAVDPASGALQGTPTTPGVYRFSIRVDNGPSRSATFQVTCTITPSAALTLAYTSGLIFSVGATVTGQLPALGNATPGVATTFTLTGGALPGSLALNPSTGAITGQVTQAGQATFTIKADNGGRTAAATATYTIIQPGAFTLAYTTPMAVPAGSAMAPQSPALANAIPGVPTTFAVTAGALPTGMALDASGIISGTPTAPGVYAFTVRASNGAQSALSAQAWTVTPAAGLGASYAAPLILHTGVAMTPQLPALANATPGVATTYAVAQGSALPSGLQLDPSNGLLQGTPTAPGVYSFTVTAGNGTRSADATVSCTVIAPGTFTVAYATPLSVAAGSAMADQGPTLANATPGVATSYALTQGALPDGLSLDAASGVLSGTPTTPGVYSFTVTAGNGTVSASASLAWTVTPAANLTLVYGTPRDFTAGSPIADQAPTITNAIPGVAPSFTVVTGAPPAGLSFDTATGVFSGTPSTAGVSAFTVRLTDGPLTADAGATYTVVPAAALTLSYTSPQAFTLGQAFTAQGGILGNPTPGVATTYALTQGALPGLAVDPATGLITGSPSAAGVFTATVTATNGTRHADAVVTYTLVPAAALTVAYPALELPAGSDMAPQGPALANAIPGAPLVFQVNGALPPGLSLASDTGILSGRPTTPGVSTFTVTVSSGPSAASTTVTCTVAPAAALTLDYTPALTLTLGTAMADQSPVVGNPIPGVALTYDLAGALPAGVGFNPATGVISGTPGALGVFPVTVTVHNGSRSAQASPTYTVNSTAALGLQYATPVDLGVNTLSYSQTPVLSNFTPGAPRTFAVSAGALPDGLSLDTTLGGIISGRPTVPGHFTATITATAGARSCTADVAFFIRPATPMALAYDTPAQPFPGGAAITPQAATVTNPIPGVANTFSLTGGALPPGLALNGATGTISGTPSAPVDGTYAFTVTAFNGPMTATADLTYQVSGAGALTLAYATPQSFPEGSLIPVQLPALGAHSANTTFAVTGGALPAGLSLDGTGALKGRPTAPGASTFTITATDGALTASATATYTVIPAAPLTLSYPSAQIFDAGAAIPARTPNLAKATPGLATTYAVTAGALPDGLSLSASSGAITGIPGTAGAFTATVTASNGARTASCRLTHTVILSGTLALAYEGPLAMPAGTAMGLRWPTLANATGGVPTTYALTGGALPAGLRLDTGTGLLWGTPTTPGVYPFTVTATNGTFTAATDVTYTVTPAAALALTYATPQLLASGTAMAVQSPALANGTPGVATSYAVTAGTLPDGTALDPSTGAITGTPATPGLFTATVAASHDTRSATAVLAYTVAPPAAFAVAQATQLTATAGAPFTGPAPVAANAPGGGPAFAVTAGALPDGLSLDPGTGVLSGTPTTDGVSTFDVTATSGAASATATVTCAVAPAPALTLGYLSHITNFVGRGSFQPANLGHALPGVATAFAVTGGVLPAGVALDPGTGLLGGTFNVIGETTFTITATNGPLSASATILNTVQSLNTPRLNYPPQTVAAGTFIVRAPIDTDFVPGAPSAFSVSAGNLPGGLSLDPDTGVLSGTPGTPGVYTFIIQQLSAGLTGMCNTTYTVTPSGALTLSYGGARTLPAGTYAAVSPTVANATPGLNSTFALTSGVLPAGMTLGGDGSVTGMPSAPGVYTFIITVTNGSLTASASATLTVAAAAPNVFYTSVPLNVGQPIAPIRPQVTGGTGLSFSTAALPAGLVLDMNSGAISGTPLAVSAVTHFVIHVVNTAGSQDVDLFLGVSGPVPVIDYGGTTLNFAVGALSSYQPANLNATAAPVNAGGWTTLSTLPDGLVLDANTGALHGQPTFAFNGIAVQVAAAGANGSANVTLTLNAQPLLPTFYYGDGHTPFAFRALEPLQPVTPTVLPAGSPNPFGPPALPIYGFASTPALPAGLQLDFQSGALTGTPAAASPMTTYTITAQAPGSGTVAAKVAFRVDNPPAPVLRYGTNAFLLAPGQDVATGIPAPSNSGGAVTSDYTVDLTAGPALPSWLVLNPGTGILTGIAPATPMLKTTCFIKAANGGGSSTVAVSLTVGADKPNISFGNLPIQLLGGRVLGTANAPNVTAANAGGPGAGWALAFPDGTPITPAAPATAVTVPGLGITFDTATGIFTGAPADLSPSSPYYNNTYGAPPQSFVVTATNAAGSASATVSFAQTSFAGQSTDMSGWNYPPNNSLQCYVGVPVFFSPNLPDKTGTGFPVYYKHVTPGYTFLQTTNGNFPAPPIPALPPGLTLNPATGVISGIPTAEMASTRYYMTAYQPQDWPFGFGNGLPNNFFLTVGPPPLTSLTYSPSSTLATPLVFIQHQAIPQLLPSFAGGRVASYAVAPALPSGLTLDPVSGIITGAPAGVQSAQPYVVTASSPGSSATCTLYLAVSSTTAATMSPVVSYDQATLTFPGGVFSSFAASNFGGAATSWNLTGTLPAGLSLNPDGSIAGKPTQYQAAPFNITVTASNAAGSWQVPLAILSLGAQPSFSYPANPLTFSTGQRLVYVPTVTGNSAATFGSPVTWSMTASSGVLPSWLTIDPASGLIGGQAPLPLPGALTVTVAATNLAGTVTADLAVAFLQAGPAISYGPDVLTLPVGRTVAFTPVNTGTPATTWALNPNSPPDGMTFETATGTLRGVPAATAGPFQGTVTATDANGLSGTTSLSLAVAFLPPVIHYRDGLLAFNTGETTAFQPSNHGSPATSWSISNLPAGLSFNTATGAITGTPNAAFATPVPCRITAANGAGTGFTTVYITAGTGTSPFGYGRSPARFAGGMTTTRFPRTQGGGILTSPLPAYVQGAATAGFSVDTSTDAITWQVASAGDPVRTSATFGTTTVALDGSAQRSPAFTFAPSSALLFPSGTTSGYWPTPSDTPARFWSLSGTLPAGLSFDPSDGTIVGALAAPLANAVDLVLTGYNDAGSVNQTVTIPVQDNSQPSPGLPLFTYGASQVHIRDLVTATAITPTVTGWPTTSWSISPALTPALLGGLDLSFDNATGTFSGTLPAVSYGITLPNIRGPFTVTASNAAGSTSQQVSVFFDDYGMAGYVPLNLTFYTGIAGSAPLGFTSGVQTSFRSFGAVPSFPLPTGLLLSTLGDTGTIGGVANVAQPQKLTLFTTISADSRHQSPPYGAPVQWQMNITVVDLVPTSLAYGNPNPSYPVGQDIVPNRPVIAPLPAINIVNSYTYSISPALPSGLVFDPVTGIISGRPAVGTENQAAVYTVTARSVSPSHATITCPVAIAIPRAAAPPAVLVAQTGAAHTAGILATGYLWNTITTVQFNPSLPASAAGATAAPFLYWDDPTHTIRSTSSVLPGTYPYSVVASYPGGDMVLRVTLKVVATSGILYPPLDTSQPLINNPITPLVPFVSGGPASSWTVAPALPPGLTINAAGTIAGTPTRAGSYAPVVTAHFPDGSTASAALNFFFTAPQSTATATANGPLNVALQPGASTTLGVTVTGGPGPFTYQWSGDSGYGTAFADIPGATGASYTPPASAIGDGIRSYLLTFTDSTGAQGAVGNFRIFLILPPPPALTLGPAQVALTAIQNGDFSMGDFQTPNASPMQSTVLSKPFYLSTFQVSEGFWLAVNNLANGTSASLPPGVDPQWPHTFVSITDLEGANGFLAKLNALPVSSLGGLQALIAGLPTLGNTGPYSKGWAWRLPTEAEWEFACRAQVDFSGSYNNTTANGDGTFNNGPSSTWLANLASFATARHTPADYLTQTPLTANAWGLDMHGFLADWVMDYYQPGYPQAAPPLYYALDPLGPAGVSDPTKAAYATTAKAIRGGSGDATLDNPTAWQSFTRRSLPQGTQAPWVGFRLVLAPIATPPTLP